MVVVDDPVVSIRRVNELPALQVSPETAVLAIAVPLRWITSQVVPSARCQARAR